MTERPEEERRDLFPRPPTSGNVTDFIVIVFTIMVATILILLTLGVPIGVAVGVVGLVGLMVMLGPEPALIKSGVVLTATSALTSTLSKTS